ncbi:MAG: HEAT repeat domain-containing protein [Chloroflexi bacterium]|nr:HEAT repeat domain-containing protein [Chloroflexota bacterium]
MFSIAVTLFVAYGIRSSAPSATPLTVPREANPSAAQTAPRGLTDHSTNHTGRAENAPTIEQNARQLATVDTLDAYHSLLPGLKQNETPSHRELSLTLLKGASSKVVPVLLDALNDSDAGVRAGAAQVLGMRREYRAIAALAAATHDPHARVRAEAALSLGEIYAWQNLSRLEVLQVNEDSLEVREAAQSAVSMIKAEIAKELGVPDYRVRDISVTRSTHPMLYAVTGSDLYVRRGTTWDFISRLPDAPLDLVTGPDGKIIYLATANSGLYHSSDGGIMWQHLQFGLHTPTQLTMTAITVDAQNAHQLYAALVGSSMYPGMLDPLGVFSSSDNGNTWVWLPGSPIHALTTNLIVDADSPGYLFGLANGKPWRYALPP